MNFFPEMDLLRRNLILVLLSSAWSCLGFLPPVQDPKRNYDEISDTKKNRY